MMIKTTNIFLALGFLVGSSQVSYAQYSGSPVPGKSQPDVNQTNTNNYSAQAPAPGQFVPAKPTATTTTNRRIRVNTSAPATATTPKVTIESLYKKLPLTVDDAKTRLIELENRLASMNSTNRASQVQIKNQVYSLSEWLQDVANAHWKMYKAFDKNSTTKLEAKSEREIALSFSKLKNRAKLLKAELFVKQKRFPEALQPLVDIVVAEPRSATGKKAYQKLVELGFSKKVSSVEIATTKSPKPKGK